MFPNCHRPRGSKEGPKITRTDGGKGSTTLWDQNTLGMAGPLDVVALSAKYAITVLKKRSRAWILPTPSFLPTFSIPQPRSWGASEKQTLGDAEVVCMEKESLEWYTLPAMLLHSQGGRVE